MRSQIQSSPLSVSCGIHNKDYIWDIGLVATGRKGIKPKWKPNAAGYPNPNGKIFILDNLLWLAKSFDV